MKSDGLAKGIAAMLVLSVVLAVGMVPLGFLVKVLWIVFLYGWGLVG